jgi:RNA polymerase sigma factor (sigma-70 family)
MSGEFKDFTALLLLNDQEAWNIFRLEMETIIDHWCKKELIEILWVANEAEMAKSKRQIFDDIFRIIHEKIILTKPFIGNFRELKEIILQSVTSYMNNGFKEFMSLLSERQERAWWRLDQDLKTRMIFWLVTAKKCSLTQAEQLYYDSLAVLTESIKRNKLDFSASRNLKSYVFRIADLKLMEMYREFKKKENIMTTELPENIVLIDEIYDEELDVKIDKLISVLENLEREILIGNYFHNENLKTISSRLCISEENCRVIKFRALKKLRIMLKHMNLTDNLKQVKTIYGA